MARIINESGIVQAIESELLPKSYLFFIERDITDDLELGIMTDLSEKQALSICKLLKNCCLASIFDYKEFGEEE